MTCRNLTGRTPILPHSLSCCFLMLERFGILRGRNGFSSCLDCDRSERARLDSESARQHRLKMKKRRARKNSHAIRKGNPRNPAAKIAQRPRMTRQLAEGRAVGAHDGPKFDGTAFLQSLKK